MTNPIESPEDFVATLKAEAESQIAEDGDAGAAQAIAFLVTAIRSRDAAVRREAQKAMFAALIRQCRNSVTSAVSEEWLRYHEGELLSGAPTRLAAEAGLRAALLALPARKEGKR